MKKTLLVLVVALLASFNTFAQKKQYNPDGVEVPDWVQGWQKNYNAKLISNKDITFYDAADYSIFYFIGDKVPNESRVVKIERNEKETLVTIKTGIYWDWNWVFWDKNTYLMDKKTGDKYMLKDIQGVYEPGRLSAIYGLKDKTIVQTLVFPPLAEEVSTIDFIEPNNIIDAPEIHNGGGFREYNVILEKYTRYQNAKVIR